MSIFFLVMLEDADFIFVIQFSPWKVRDQVRIFSNTMYFFCVRGLYIAIKYSQNDCSLWYQNKRFSFTQPIFVDIYWILVYLGNFVNANILLSKVASSGTWKIRLAASLHWSANHSEFKNKNKDWFDSYSEYVRIG